MPNTLTIPNTIPSGGAVESAPHNQNYQAVATFLNVTKLNDDNLQDAGISGTKLKSTVVDDSTLQIAAGVLSVKDAGITQAKRAALGQQISSSSATFTTSSGTAVDVTNLSVSITTTGRPVWIGLVSDGSGNSSSLYSTKNADTTDAILLIKRGSTEIANHRFLSANTSSGASVTEADLPVSTVWHIDAPAAGTYTYKLQAYTTTSSTVGVSYAQLVAYEL